MATKNCEKCGRGFGEKLRPYQLKKQKHCSFDCYRPPLQITERKCTSCKKRFVCGRRGTLYCSRSCAFLDHPGKLFKGYESISGTYYSKLKIEARLRGIEFDVSIEYLWELFVKQKGKCSLSGIEITLEKSVTSARKNCDLQTASLDRIDSGRGYFENNVQWVHKRINCMKNSDSDSEFIEWIEIVHNYQTKKRAS
jgi:hypothetical protein